MPFPFIRTHSLHLQMAGDLPVTVEWMVLASPLSPSSGCRLAYTREMLQAEQAGGDTYGMPHQGWCWRPLTGMQRDETPDAGGWKAPGGFDLPGGRAGLAIIVRHDARSPANGAAWARWGSAVEVWIEGARRRMGGASP